MAITRLDHPRADFDETLARMPARRSARTSCRSTSRCSATTAQSIAGLIGLITLRVLDYSRRLPAAGRASAEPEHLTPIEEARNELIEGIIAESEDETLMDRYLARRADRAPTCSIADLEKAVARGNFYPVHPGLRGDRRRPRRAARRPGHRRARRRWSTTCRWSPAWTARRARR